MLAVLPVGMTLVVDREAYAQGQAQEVAGAGMHTIARPMLCIAKDLENTSFDGTDCNLHVLQGTCYMLAQGTRAPALELPMQVLCLPTL